MKKYYKFDLDLIIANVVALAIFAFGIFVYFVVFKSNIFTNKYFGLELLIMLLYFGLHEVCHGIGYSLFVKDKKNIKYGAALEKSVFYAMCQEEISKKGIIISLLFPLLFLSIISGIIAVIFNINYLLLLSIMNLAGASGDIIMLFFVLKLPEDINYIDYDNSIGCTFTSKNDLSKYKGFGIKFVESKEHKKSLIKTDIPKIEITKWSYIIMIIFVLIAVLNMII